MSHHSHKAAAKPGAPKKEGGGGKGTWGKTGSEYGASSGTQDSRDPNYDSEGDEVPPPTPATVVYKAGVANILDEYFVSGDAGDVGRALKELGHPELHHEFVKSVISRSLDLHDRERELASDLLPRVHTNPISSEKLVEGFTVLLERLEDLKLDIPQAPEYLANFLARAVVDDLLPPSFLSPDNADVEIAKETLLQARNLISGKSAAKRISHIWGASGGQSVKRIKEKCISIIEEYLVSNDIAETDKAIMELGAPSFHYYIVKKAVLIGVDSKEQEREKIYKLLSSLYKSGLISDGNISVGFTNCINVLDDIELDTPNGRELLGTFIQRSQALGFLTDNTIADKYKQALAQSNAKRSSPAAKA